MITPEELVAIRERCEAATPGPWGVGDPDSNMLPHSSNNEVVAKSFLVVSRNVYGKDSDNQTYANIVFIAHARSDIPRLLDEVEKLRAALESMVEAFSPHDAPSDCFATGPLTGDIVQDYIVCPGCVAHMKAKEALK